jgi:hypothetical protein
MVLADKSSGEPGDVRNVEALLLPPDPDPTAPTLITEQFQAEPAELQPALQASKSLLSGRGFLIFLARWLVAGRRPYPRWVASTLFLGWLAVVGLILTLLFGPEPGGRLFVTEAVLAGLWVGLMVVEVVVVAAVAWRAWKTAVVLANRLENSQTRLRMNGGLTLKGGSAGLSFGLNVLLSLYRGNPTEVRASWLWQQFFRRSCSEVRFWAATGVLMANGRIKQVVLRPKLRACLKHGGIHEILIPNQLETTEESAESVANAGAKTIAESAADEPIVPRVRLGFAAEQPALRLHRCGHIAKAVMELGGLRDRWQPCLNAFALLVSLVMLAALPDLRSVLLPHPVPVAVPPSSPSPYSLWVSLNTTHPAYFRVVLESDYWSNRRSEVRQHTELTPSVRAEIPFHRLTGMSPANEEDGVVWLERRRRFLTREFLPGERVGRYSIPYLSHLGHE